MKFSYRTVICGLGILPVFLFSCGGSETPAAGNKNQAPPIEGFIVKPQNVNEQVEVQGTVLPLDEVVLMPEIAGRIISLNIPEGSMVQKGALLVKLFDADLQAQLKKLEAQLQTAKTTEARQKELLKVNGISQQEYDLSLTQVATFEADIAGIKAQISKTEIRAPFDGTIGLRRVSEGAYVSPGTEIAVLRSDRRLKLDFSVPETYAGTVEKGMKLAFSIDGDTNLYHAEVIASEQQVEAGTLNMSVRALIEETNTRLIPGASVSVNLTIGGSAEALMIPSNAVIPQARFKNVIVSRNGKAEMVKVSTGIRRTADVEIRSGLKTGDTIVTTGIQFIRPGTVLHFTAIK